MRDGLRLLRDRTDGSQNNLTAGEIAAQVLWAKREAANLPDTTPQRLTNVVFMGMGEPMANERHVFDSLDLLTGAAGIGARATSPSAPSASCPASNAWPTARRRSGWR